MAKLIIDFWVKGHHDEGIKLDKPDYAGGWSLWVGIINNTDKDWKYLTLYVSAINAVNDVIPSDIVGDETVYKLQVTGPIKAHENLRKKQGATYFENFFYGFTVEKFVLNKAVIDYFDGTSETIEKTDIEYIKASACYVATCIYGSYDCPQVWTLRRYRDNTLKKTWYGQLFINIYYSISPTFVKLFGKTKLFRKMLKPILDKVVEILQNNGFESTPYQDK